MARVPMKSASCGLPKSTVTRLTYTLTKDGKKIGHGKVVVAADGKSRTVTETMPNADGKSVDGRYFFDKQ